MNLSELLLARRKTITPADARSVMQSRNYLKARVGEKTFDDAGKDEKKYAAAIDVVKGDEIELIPPTPGVALSDEEWRNRKLNYLGRVTISRYGCYGCHDIPNFESARPIGTALQDWGLKDPSRLAPEHIEEFLHHHGEPDGSSTRARVEAAIQKAKADDFDSHEQEKQELGAAFFYESLAHHGRAGFIWQKLRDPRSYDYEKIETKFYDERLRMPKFPLNEKEIESISTFVLGLVARPPAEKYQYRPKGAELVKVEGEKLLQKFNCTGCHMVDLPELAYGVKLDEVQASELGAGDHPESLELLKKLKPPRNGLTKQTHRVKTAEGSETLPVATFRGTVSSRPLPDDEPDEAEYGYDLWETLELNGKVLFPGARMLVPAARLVSEKPARGGRFAEWLVNDLMKLSPDNNRFLSMQMSPPPLYLEGLKVQTSWLYSFLKNPYQIRHTTVMRMPKFNMSDAEAQTLANYFAAYDGAAFPYQDIPERQPAYLSMKNAEFHDKYPNRPGDYLQESWRVVAAPICSKCHAVGGREYKSTDPKKDIRGPNLDHVANRLRPDWMLLWLYKPSFITPYTSMPVNYPPNQKQFPELFGGQGKEQTIAIRDALLNYPRLMEREGRLPEVQVVAPAADAKPTDAEKK